MTIVPVLKRELIALARSGGEHASRSFFAVVMLGSMLGTFTVWYHWAAEQATNDFMALFAERAFLITIVLHGIVLITIMGQTATCIAVEKDRRTLDFLLATRLSSTEIVVGKLAAYMLVFLVTLAAGLPIMLLLNQLGGVDGRLILTAYAGIVSTGFLLAAFSIWFSATAPDSRRALGRAFLCFIAWFLGPFFVAFLLPRAGCPPTGLAACRQRMASGQQPRKPFDEVAEPRCRNGIDRFSRLDVRPAIHRSRNLPDRGDCAVTSRLPGRRKRRGSHGRFSTARFTSPGDCGPGRRLATIPFSGESGTRIARGGWRDCSIFLSISESRRRLRTRRGSLASQRWLRSGIMVTPRD